jgi:hypothetical protein
VNQKEYTGWAYPSHKVDYSIGERVVVHYDPIDPAHNFPASFEEAGGRDLFFVPFCLMIIAGLPLFIFFRRRASNQSS